ncbi:hypothetical protein HYALB_00011546 [Hymenoscyphus albidus]|uniref:Peptidase S53 domain-containing protein n=1 Tax=Hymenoscyphus albidus TaxID=595503 RepID=A0A9N9Q6W3_9HELO|nr:hypothetical protein HYALB_00011546 [Hymenoscyphus albidus]
MRVQLIVHVLAALVVAVSTSPFKASNHVVHKRRMVHPHQWAKQHRLHPRAVFPLRIGLMQQNIHRAEEFIHEVSHPASARYGKHWTPEKVAEVFASSPETVYAVKAWLSAEGIEGSRIRTSRSRSWLEFNATVQEAERLLRAEYHMYSHDTGHKHIACKEYSIPEHLLGHIDIITPTVDFDQKVLQPRHMLHGEQIPASLQMVNKREVELRTRKRDLGKGIVGSADDGSNPKEGPAIINALMTLENCDTMITVACLQALYDMPIGSKAMNNNTLGIVEYTPQAFLQKDLDMFFREFAPQQVGQSPETLLIDGATVQTLNQSFALNGESALDLQYAMALIYPQKVTLYQVGDLVSGASFNNFLDALDGSYCDFQGGDSPDPNIDGQYPSKQPGGYTGPKACRTVQSTKVISTSYGFNEADLSARYTQRQCAEYMKLGLQGVTILYSSGDSGVAGNGGMCIGKNGAYNNGSEGAFNPIFPGGCPWVTSIGATQVLNGSTVRTPEVAAQRVISSGGGFSNIFPMPLYQRPAVTSYFAQNKISFGTSASAPTFGVIINMVNKERAAVGKGPVGFVNPVLYGNSRVLTDVRFGSNPGCGTGGFNASEGWDPVTGLGTPNYPEMLGLFMGLP